MSEAKHTPGPWHLEQRPDKVRVEPDIAVVYVQGSRYDGSQSKTRAANARLIAAAPDLLAALENLENDDDSIPPHAWAMVQNAIAKAKGACP